MFNISCEEAKELIEQSKGDIYELDLENGALLVHHTEGCEQCHNKWQEAKKKLTGK